MGSTRDTGSAASERLFRDVAARLTANLRRHRAAQGMTQEELAERVGVEPRWIGAIEQKATNPSLRLLASLAGALETDVTSLLAPAPAPNRRKPGRPRTRGPRRG